MRSLVNPHTSPSPSSPPLKGGELSQPSPLEGEGEGEGALLMNSLVTCQMTTELARYLFPAGYLIVYAHCRTAKGDVDMPIYEYRCRKCNETFEVIQKVNEDNSDLRCPKCETDRPERLLSAFCAGSAKGGSSSQAPGHSSPGHS